MKTFYLALLACVIILGGCREFESHVSSEIAKKVSNGEGTIINIVQLTNFDWNKLYIFKPYSTRDIIHKVTNNEFLKANEIQMGVSEGNTFLVFMKNNKIIKYFNHPRACGDFADFEGNYIILTPNNDNFKVVQEGYSLYGKWLKLRVAD